MSMDQRRETEPTPRPVRVLMVAPTSFFADYGCHVRILEEMTILQQMGHHVTLATYHNGKNLPGLDIRRTLPIPWRRHYEVGSSRHKIAFDMLLGMKTVELLARNRFDLIHAHLHEGALIGIVLGRLFRLPVLFDFQGSLTEEMVDHGFLNREGRLYKPLRRLERWIDRHADAILTSSVHAQRLLVNEFDCKPEQVHALPDCVNSDTFCPADQQSPEQLHALRARLGIPPERRLIVYLGLLAEHQGVSHLLEAMPAVLAQHPDAHLLLMGFPNESLYRAKAQALGIGERVTVPGRITYHEAPQYLALGDVAAAPKLSATEGAGKLLNYMALALPTVAFDTPVAKEYLGLDGFLAQRGSVESLQQALSQALSLVKESPDQARYVGQRLRRRAQQHFSWEMAGKQIVEIYGEMLARPGVAEFAGRQERVQRRDIP